MKSIKSRPVEQFEKQNCKRCNNRLFRVGMNNDRAIVVCSKCGLPILKINRIKDVK